MNTVTISVLRANLLGFLKKASLGETVIVTSKGRQLAKITPIEDPQAEARKRLKQLRKTAVLGDVLSPVDESWEVNS